MSKTLSKFILLFAVLIILFFAFAPGKWTPAWVVNHDKLSHMMLFFVLAILLKITMPKIKVLTQILILIGFAISIELMQLWFFNSGFSVQDLIYDLYGIGLFVFMYLVLKTSGIQNHIRLKFYNHSVE